MSDDRGDLAAEFALGVLAGDELHRARQLARTDPEFRAEAARWSGRLAPMLDGVEGVSPPATLWDAIAHSIAPRDAGNVIELRRRASRWRAAAAAMTAVAACLALFIAVRPGAPPQPVPIQAAPAPLVASLGDNREATKVVASWDPAGRRLVLIVAGDMPIDSRHSHELWVIPQDQKPRSLGTIGSKKQMHMQLADTLATLLQQGATIAISVEPRGGSPTGAPTGPVVASGSLTST